LLIDGDPNRSATGWAKRGKMPFTVVDKEEGTFHARNYEHVVIDTEARAGQADFEVLARGCHLLVIPSVPATLDTDALVLTLGAARQLAPNRYRVLLTKVPPPPEPEGAQLRAILSKQEIPVFTADIPRLKSFEKAAAEGVPVYEVNDPRAHRAWAAYESVGKEVVKAVKAYTKKEALHA
jgi:chromosome partitioning protein